MFSIPSSACSLQYSAVLIPSTLKTARLVQESREHLVIVSETLASEIPRVRMPECEGAEVGRVWVTAGTTDVYRTKSKAT